MSDEPMNDNATSDDATAAEPIVFMSDFNVDVVARLVGLFLPIYSLFRGSKCHKEMLVAGGASYGLVDYSHVRDLSVREIVELMNLLGDAPVRPALTHLMVAVQEIAEALEEDARDGIRDAPRARPHIDTCADVVRDYQMLTAD